jgi:hypothetical protein
MQKAKDLLHHHHHTEKPETSREAVEHAKPTEIKTKPLTTTETKKPVKTHEKKTKSGHEHKLSSEKLHEKHKHSPEKLHEKHKLSSEKLHEKHKHSPEKFHKEKLGHEHFHEHQHLHEHKHPGEVHVHEHEHKGVGKYGNVYREGTDPLVNREVICETHSQGGVIREVVSEPAVVKEVVKPVELHKIQPVVHREREQREIRHVVEPVQKFEVDQTKVIHRERDINLGVRRDHSTLETSRAVGHAPHLESTREIDSIDRQHQDLPVRVEEHVHKVVEEHVHPVIYKEVLKPKVLEETHHIYETVQESPVETYKVKEHGGERGLRDKLLEAEREFFAHESARGLVCPVHHKEHHMHHGEHVHHAESLKQAEPLKHTHAEHLQHTHTHPEHLQHTHTHTHTHPEHVHTLPKEIKKESPKLHKKKKSPKLSKKKKESPEHKKKKEAFHQPSVSAPYGTTGVTHAEPIIGHHQNIGGHHIPASVMPTGQSSAYDAALAHMPLSSRHSERDKEMIRKMDEKHVAERNARRTGLATDTHHNVV